MEGISTEQEQTSWKKIFQEAGTHTVQEIVEWPPQRRTRGVVTGFEPPPLERLITFFNII